MKSETPILTATTLLPFDYDDLSRQGGLIGEDGKLSRAESVAIARDELEDFLCVSSDALPAVLGSIPDQHDHLAGCAGALTGSDRSSERSRAALILEVLCGRGNETAIFNFALALVQGVVVPRNVPRAESMLQQLHHAVDPTAKPVLFGLVLDVLAGLRAASGDMHGALHMFEEAASLSAQSAFAAGLAYDKKSEEFGVERDPQRAMALYEMAASRGHVHAMTNLGVLLAACASETRSPAEGWELLREASRLGDSVADEAMERYAAMGLSPTIPRPAYEHTIVRAMKRRNSVAFFLGVDEIDSDQDFEDELEFNARSTARHQFELPAGARVIVNMQREGRMAIREGMASFYRPDDAKCTRPFAFALFDLVGRGRYVSDVGLYRALDEDSSGNLHCGELVRSMFPEEGMCDGFDRIGFACNFYELQFRPSEKVEFDLRVQLAKQFMDRLSRDFRAGLHLVASDRPLVTRALVAMGGSVVDDIRVAYGLPGVARRLAALNIAGQRLQ